MIHSPQSVPPSKPHLWHLLPACELYKLDTFLCGGLWCAELGTIVAFEGDFESTLPYGFFVSCWNMNTKPSPQAWQIFGGNGRGLAIRTNTTALEALAQSIGIHNWTVHLGVVEYRQFSTVANPSPFYVSPTHAHEDEARLVIAVENATTVDSYSTSSGNELPRFSSRGQTKQYKSASIIGPNKAEAIVLPISPTLFIEEILMGSKLTDAEKTDLTRRISEAGLGQKIRFDTAEF